MRQTVTGYEATPPVVDRASRLIVCTCQRMSPCVCAVSSRRAWEPLAQRDVENTDNIWNKKTDRLHTELQCLI